MKALVLIVTFASVALSFGAPLQAAASLPAMATLTQTLTGSVDRRRHQCDTPAQIATNPVCWKV